MKISIIPLFLLAFGVASISMADPKSKPTPTPIPTPPPIPISYLPFAIVAPGTYVLTGNLSYLGTDSVNPVAIGINVPLGGLGGAVIIDFKGFTITDTTTSSRSEGIRVTSDTPIQYPITIRNGTLVSFNWGVYDLNISGITINNMTFNNVSTPLQIDNPNTIINNCNF